MKTYTLTETAKELIIKSAGLDLKLNFELKNMNDQDFFMNILDLSK